MAKKQTSKEKAILHSILSGKDEAWRYCEKCGALWSYKYLIQGLCMACDTNRGEEYEDRS